MRVWITRTEPGASRLGAALRAAGHQAWVRPVLRIEPLAAPQPAGRFAVTVFLSAHAVAAAFANGWRQTPAIAIGPATSHCLRERGVAARAPAVAETEGIIEMLAEDLPQSALLAAGEDGRGALRAWLRERGVRVSEWLLYRRVPVAGALPPSASADAIAVGSAAGLRVAAHLWFASGGSAATPLMAPSERVARQARQAGFKHVLTTGGADAAAVLGALRELENTGAGQ